MTDEIKQIHERLDRQLRMMFSLQMTQQKMLMFINSIAGGTLSNELFVGMLQNLMNDVASMGVLFDQEKEAIGLDSLGDARVTDGFAEFMAMTMQSVPPEMREQFAAGAAFGVAEVENKYQDMRASESAEPPKSPDWVNEVVNQPGPDSNQ